jgi:ferredoxin-type protein NapG
LSVAHICKSLAVLLVGVAAAYEIAEKVLPAAVPLRPPGAGEDEADFLARCIRCGKCGLACPYDVVFFDDPARPVPVSGDALSGTPRIYPARGACRLCADLPCIAACPSGALQPLQDRRQVRMGLAVLDRDRCVALKGMRCEVCYRSCPLIDEAISIDYYLREGDAIHAVFEPVVSAEACVGCGICEQRCVIQDPPAIRVTPESGLPKVSEGSRSPLDYNPNLKRRAGESSEEPGKYE